MLKKDAKSKEKYEEVLELLLDDPTQSAREIGKKMNSYRQMVWRKKKELEDNKVIWGYTAVIDESKMNHVIYMMLIKSKPMSRGLADLIIRRITRIEMLITDSRIFSRAAVILISYSSYGNLPGFMEQKTGL